MTEKPQEIGSPDEASASQLRLYPWLIALGSLLLYLLTLNHWITLDSLPWVAKVTGWDWHPGYADWRPTNFAPLLYILTFPSRLFPTAWQPALLNIFSAVCAALTLALLARSVQLLPHDRSREQRMRETDSDALLEGWRSCVPPLLAVLVCGLQITFWESATAASGEMLDLLVFAYLIRCLLEFRISKRNAWLIRFTFAYGLGVANNWALVGFFPFFLVSFIWIKGVSFFEWPFIKSMVGWGALGLSLYLFLPLVNSLTDGENFFNLLRAELSQQFYILRAIPGWLPLMLALPTLVALLFVGIRWPSFQGDFSAIGSAVSTFAFRLMHVIFFGVSLWVFLEIKYSPRLLGAQFPSLKLLSFYYMAALSVGYFSGYLLLVFGTNPRAYHRTESASRKLALHAITLLVYVPLLAAPIYLAYANYPKITALNGPALEQYAADLTRALPEKGCLILSDDRTRMQLLQASYVRQGKPIENTLIETASFKYGAYLLYLKEHSPLMEKLIPSAEQVPAVVQTMSLIKLLATVNAQTNTPARVFYLHPSYGAYFEYFYAIPKGLIMELKPYPSSALEHPPLTAQEINETQSYWDKLPLKSLIEQGKESTDANVVNRWYSRSLNHWGVELQKANRLKEANIRFDQSAKLNPQNFLAEINKQFNENLQQGNTQSIDSKDLTRTRSFDAMFNAFGPVDEPELQLLFGQALAASGNLRQAFELFQRRLALNPGDFQAQVSLAKTYVDLRMPEKAIELIRKVEPQATTLGAQAEVLRIQVLIFIEKKDFAGAEKLLKAARQQKPNDEMRLSLQADFYRIIGVEALRDNKPDLAKEHFKSSLLCLDDQLQILKALNKNESAEESDVLLKRAQLQIQLLDYDNAIAGLTQVLKQQPENTIALMNRAIARLQSKKLAGARADYKSLLRKVPKGLYAAYYGLAEIAYQEKDTSAAIKNYRLYLKLAPTNAPEYKISETRLQELKRGS